MTRPTKVFMDTDVVLDFVLRREPHFMDAAKLFQAGMERKIELLVSASSLKDVFYFARKAVLPTQSGSEKRGREVIRLLLQIAEVCPLDRLMWEEALQSVLKDTEDALQLACAGRNQADFLVTRNFKDYQGAIYPQIVVPKVLLLTLASGTRPADA